VTGSGGNSQWRIIGDGRTLQVFTTQGTQQTVDVDLDVSGVNVLSIEVFIQSSNSAAGQRAQFAFAGEVRP